jgi:membrane associated rhomboid family serine protease
VSGAIHTWIAAPLIAIFGLLFWRTRRQNYACLPGLAIGFVLGVLLVDVDLEAFGPAAGIVYEGALGGTIGAGINVILKEDHRVSGLAAIVAAVVYCLLL